MEWKIVHSRDVVFLEDQMIDDFEKPNKPKSTLNSIVDLCPNTFPKSLDDRRATIDDSTHDNHGLRKVRIVLKLSHMLNHLHRRSRDPQESLGRLRDTYHRIICY